MKRREGVGSCEERRVFAGSGWAATKGEWRVGGVQWGGRGGGVRKAREGKEGIWIPAKTRSSAKHTVQECQHTPTPTWSSTKKEWRVKETR